MAGIKSVDPLWRDLLLTLLTSVGVGLVTGLLLAILVLAWSGLAEAGPGTELQQLPRMEVGEAKRGSLLLKLASGGVSVDAPMLQTDVEMDASGILARVSVKQRFRNPGSSWVEGIYVFPLPEDAAVDRMRLRIGERLIEGEIKERGEARKQYQQAKRQGKKASLLSQERPNIFTTAVANIGPGEEVQVEIEYQQSIRYDQGRFSLRFPLVVAPRYIPGNPTGPSELVGFSGSGWAHNTDQVPDAERITPPVAAPGQGHENPVSIRVNLNVGFPLARLESAYHPIESLRDEQGVHRIRLQQKQVPADRDFELSWTPQVGQAPRAALFTEQWQGEEYALLMVMPPAAAGNGKQLLPRELILVIDTSGSMHGNSIAQAREAVKLALRRLAPTDRFNLIQFNSRVHALFGQAVAATPGNLQRALAYVDGLEAQGGTEMLPALERALDGSESEGMLRQVIFVTDGSVGNEEQLFTLIQQRLGASRLFTLGIGSAPNSHFMTRAAEFGRGSFTYVGKLAEVKEKMNALFAKLESPALTDIRIHWPDGSSVDQWPVRIPDLYHGEPVVLAARMADIPERLEISGQESAKAWQQQVRLSGGAPSPGVHLYWVRRKIAQLMGERGRGLGEAEVREQVLKLALRHKLVSRYTSLVAVDKTPSRPQGETLKKGAVPTHLPHGWRAEKVFGQLPQTATPAPLKLLLGILALLAGWLMLSCARGAGTRAGAVS